MTPGGRLLGAETEYAIRFRPADGMPRPGNDVLYRAIREAVEKRVRASPARGLLDRLRQRIWWENGGSLYYEFGPDAPEGGLVEAGTPECRGPRELLVYQLAQDRLLTEATADALETLRAQGIAGELSLLKNCRDVQGRVYGAQENYEVELASGGALLGWRLGMALGVVLALCVSALQWSVRLLALLVLVVVGAGAFVVFLVAVLARSMTRSEVDRWSGRLQAVFSVLDRAESWFAQKSAAPVVAWVASLVWMFGYRRYRRPIVGFLATRSVLTGAGTLFPDGSFGLSEKGPNISRIHRWTASPHDRGILEIGHLVKPLLGLGWLEVKGLPQLFRRRQRLQVGLSDSNLCETAEYLKLGTTSLVLDLAEAGRLADAPRLADPVGAVVVASADPTLRGWLTLEGGATIRVLELQRFYWQRAADWIADAEAPPLEAYRIVDLWGKTLDALEHHPESLFGRLDWVTKLQLLTQAHDLPWEARKKIDLRYHELGTGYQQWLDDAGLCQHLVDDAEVVGACRRPPSGTPAEARADRVREVAPPLAIPEATETAAPAKVIDFAAARARRSAGPTSEP
jgi:proteasome accessory factor A